MTHKSTVNTFSPHNLLKTPGVCRREYHLVFQHRADARYRLEYNDIFHIRMDHGPHPVVFFHELGLTLAHSVAHELGFEEWEMRVCGPRGIVPRECTEEQFGEHPAATRTVLRIKLAVVVAPSRQI